MNQYKILRDPYGVEEKFFGKCWTRTRCQSPLEVKMDSGALLGPKHARLGRDNPILQEMKVGSGTCLDPNTLDSDVTAQAHEW